jgi:predicted TIM-barrel fold metal-dependent hydrolase
MEVIDKNLGAVPRDVSRKILHDNAARLYHIDL